MDNKKARAGTRTTLSLRSANILYQSKGDLKMKKLSLLGITVLSVLTLAACSGSNENSASESSKSTSVSSEKSKATDASDATSSNDASENEWTFKDDTFSAGILTYKIVKTEIRNSVTEGEKNLVIYTDVTNNSSEEQDPSNIYMVLHAYQKTDTANKQLNVGMSELDENGNNPLQQYEDALNDKLLPGKTTQAVITFTLENTNPVTLEFSDSNFEKIGEKVINVE